MGSHVDSVASDFTSPYPTGVARTAKERVSSCTITTFFSTTVLSPTIWPFGERQPAHGHSALSRSRWSAKKFSITLAAVQKTQLFSASLRRPQFDLAIHNKVGGKQTCVHLALTLNYPTVHGPCPESCTTTPSLPAEQSQMAQNFLYYNEVCLGEWRRKLPKEVIGCLLKPYRLHQRLMCVDARSPAVVWFCSCRTGAVRDCPITAAVKVQKWWVGCCDVRQEFTCIRTTTHHLVWMS